MTTLSQTGRTAPVTLISGYRGLAESLIEVFLNREHRLSVLVRNPSALESLKKRFPQVFFVTGNIQNKQDCERWITETLNQWGRIDHLVNNAAITGPTGKLEELDFEELEKTVSINFLSPIFLIQTVLPTFKKQNSGTVVNLSGGGATAPRPHFGAYGASKCALVRFTESLALEYPNLSFYSVAPGALKTPMMEGISKIPFEKIGKEQTEALQRMEVGGDDPKKAAELILWLCSHKPKSLNGKLISAKWDNYQNPPKNCDSVPFWTLRRVDTALAKNLKDCEGIG